MSGKLRCSEARVNKLGWEHLQTALLENWSLVRRVIRNSGVPEVDVDEVANDVFLKLRAWHENVLASKLTAIFKNKSTVSHFLWRCAANAAMQWHRDNQKSRRECPDGDGQDERSLEELIDDGRTLSRQKPLNPLEQLLEHEREKQAPRLQDEARQKIRCLLRQITSGGGKQLALALIRLGVERSFCSDPADTLLWVRWYVYSDYPQNFQLKRAEVTAALLAQEGWTRGKLDLNNKRLKLQFTKAFEEHCDHKPVERRKAYRRAEKKTHGLQRRTSDRAAEKIPQGPPGYL